MKPGRNDPCPCGSGKKYKHCHMQADEAPRPEDLTWRRLHRAIDGLAGQLLNVAMRHFGPEGIHEAWQEFNLWPEGEPEFDPEAADVTIFLPWFLYHWLPDSEDTQTPPGAQGTTVAKAYLAAAGDRVEPMVRRYIQACLAAPFSFHEVLSCDPGRGFRLCDVMLGSEVDVIEHSGSLDADPGTLLFAKVVPIDGIAVLDGCSPVLIPPRSKPLLIELRADLVKEVGTLTPEVLRELDLDLIELYLDITDDVFDPQLPELTNTDGDALEFHELIFDIDSPRTAFDALIDLAAGMSAAELLNEAEFDDAGELVRAQLFWRRLGDTAYAGSLDTVLGQIEIEAGRLTATVNSARRADELRGLIEERLGEHGRFRIASIQSMESLRREMGSEGEAGVLDEDENGADLNELPEVQAAMAEFMRNHYRAWVDQNIPALSGRTPREAARDADGREAVAALILQLERDGARMRPPLDPAIVQELRETLGLAAPD